MKFTFDASELSDHLRRLKKAPDEIEERLWDGLVKIHKETMGQVKVAMPVDTGRSRASWGEWTPALLRKGNEGAKASDAINELDRGNLTTTQGTRVPYTKRLNEGWSRQAPAGFIDLAAEKARLDMEELAKRIGLKVIG